MKNNRPLLRVSTINRWAVFAVCFFLISGCGPSVKNSSSVTNNHTDSSAAGLLTPTSPVSNLPSTPQAFAEQGSYGPDPNNFPAGINPLTGEAVGDPSLLKVPALLVSISNFPVTARPQGGLSFAPFVYEFSITEGQSRFLAVFYGQYPAPEIPLSGDCAVRTNIFNQTGTLIGNRVWLDTNKNGVQDPEEQGVGGLCVNLYDAQGNLLQNTTTDTNGYYGFNVEKGQAYRIGFIKPAKLDFTGQNVGDENHDSDADPQTGRTELITIVADNLFWDAGLYQNDIYLPPTPDPKHDPKPQVGPVRSGRLLYAYLGGSYQNSCLMYAFASPEVLEKIPKCSFVTHEDSGGGSMLEIDRMKAIAEDNMHHTADRPFNYTSNVFADTVPGGGTPGTKIDIYFASLNQSGWRYDPLYQAYLRFTDTADKNNPGILHADSDRLTGRQLYFDNVVIIMADTDVVSPTNLDIHLDEGNDGYAYLFRDGKMFPIRWSTRAGDYEKQTGFRRPIQFLNNDGSPALLKPGHTWVTIVTPYSSFEAVNPGEYLLIYGAPKGESR